MSTVPSRCTPTKSNTTTANFRTEREEVLHRYTTSDAMILELMMTGTVIGSLLGLPVTGAASASAILHVFEFRNGLISHENVWFDSTAIVDQLSRREPRDGKSLYDSGTAGGELISHLTSPLPLWSHRVTTSLIRSVADAASAPASGE